MATLTVSSKGWIVIPAELRRKYNLVPGAEVVVVDYGGALSIVPAERDAVGVAYGRLREGASLTELCFEGAGTRRREIDMPHTHVLDSFAILRRCEERAAPSVELAQDWP